MKIIIDAMGGDNAPLEIVKGALQGKARFGVDIVLTGDTTAILPFSRDCGAVIIDIDHATDYAAALAAVEGHCILNGNIDPVSEVFSCDAETTKQALHACHHAAGGCRTLFMPGCELPTQTPLENVKAIAEAIAEIGAVQ